MESNPFELWTKYIISEYGSDSVFLRVIDQLKDSEFPVIFDVDHLCDYLDLYKFLIYEISNDSSKFYRTFSIPKRRGGLRTIKTPYPALKHIQRWINDNILSYCNVHEAAIAYRKNKSIRDNAAAHLGSNAILKLDIEDFFPSINYRMVYPVFKNIGYTEKLAFYLSMLCLDEGSLPQGAPSSPALSNIILYYLDKRIAELTKVFGFKYTRYADDITISGERIPWRFVGYVQNIIVEEGFKVNHQKTQLILSPKKIVTGISISNEKLSIPRATRRAYRSLAFNMLKLTPLEYLENEFSNDPVCIERIIGKFTFWLMIEPENKYVQTTLNKLKLLNNSYKVQLQETIG